MRQEFPETDALRSCQTYGDGYRRPPISRAIRLRRSSLKKPDYSTGASSYLSDETKLNAMGRHYRPCPWFPLLRTDIPS